MSSHGPYDSSFWNGAGSSGRRAAGGVDDRARRRGPRRSWDLDPFALIRLVDKQLTCRRPVLLVDQLRPALAAQPGAAPARGVVRRIERAPLSQDTQYTAVSLMQYGGVARCVVYCIDVFGVGGVDDFGVRASLCVCIIHWGCIEGGVSCHRRSPRRLSSWTPTPTFLVRKKKGGSKCEPLTPTGT